MDHQNFKERNGSSNICDDKQLKLLQKHESAVKIWSDLSQVPVEFGVIYSKFQLNLRFSPKFQLNLNDFPQIPGWQDFPQIPGGK